MSNITLALTRFHSGELDPMLAAAVDTEAYQTGCRSMENYILTQQGTPSKRPGSWYRGSTKDDNTAVFHSFRSADGDYFMFEFTALVCRFWNSDGELVESSPGTVLEVVTPYTEGNLQELCVDVDEASGMWIFHRSHAPRKITYSAGTFSISTPTFTGDRTFAATNKYPGIGKFHAGRLFVGGTNDEPTAIFASKTPVAATGATQYTVFTLGTAADDAIYLQESDMLGAKLQWFAVQRRLICGTNRTIWMSDEAPPTPTSFDMAIQAHNGSEALQAQPLDSVLCYVGRAGRSLRVAAYSDQSGGLVDNNIAKRSSHVLAKGITSIGIQTLPVPMIWISLADGTFASYFIDMGEAVIGCTPQRIAGDGFVEYLDVLRKDGGDDLYLCVKRTIDGETKRYVEIIHSINPYGAEIEEEHFVDCGIRTTTADGEIEGLDYLEGEVVDILADGAVKPPKTVASGIVSIPKAAEIVHVGLGYRAKALMRKPEVPTKGSSQGKIKKIEEALIRVHNTRGGAVGQSLDELQRLLYDKYGEIEWGATPGKFTGDVRVILSGTADESGDIWVVCDDPVEFNLLGVFPRVNICEM